MFPSRPSSGREAQPSHGVGPQTLGAQCGTYFGAGEEVRGVVKVCFAEWV